MSYPAVPVRWSNEEEHRIKLAQAINALLAGKTNARSTVTLTANTASTTVTDARIAAESLILLCPTTANAAAALSSTYQSSATSGSLVLTHANTATTDRTFIYIIFS